MKTCLSTLLLLLSLMPAAVLSAGLQVVPTTVDLKAGKMSEGLWLSNTGTEALQVQVRVNRWTQGKDGDRLTPSREIVASPPVTAIPPGGKQLVRIVRTGAPPAASEEAYRLIINELPRTTLYPDRRRSGGLSFMLQYSVPVFIHPAGTTAMAPALTWRLRRTSTGTRIEISNQGNRHAQLTDLSYVAHNGKRTLLKNGMLGYVLPHATLSWQTDKDHGLFSPDGHFDVQINGITSAQEYSTF